MRKNNHNDRTSRSPLWSALRQARWRPMVSRLALIGALAGAPLLLGGAPDISANDRGAQDRNPIDSFFEGQDSIDQGFEETAREVDAMFLEVERQINEAFAEAEREIAGMWGEEAVMPERSRWVGYSDDLQDRVIVDYEKGTITVQSVKDQSPEHLRQVLKDVLGRSSEELNDIDPIVRKLKEKKAKSADPFDDDFFDDEPERSSGGPGELGRLVNESTIKLEGYSRPQPQPPVYNAPRSASDPEGTYYPPSQPKRLPPKPPARKPEPPRQQLKVDFGDDWHSRNAEKYADQVFAMAQRYNLKPSIIFAIIHTESSFNPRARSAVPAYGLMQLVPTSGGLDAWRALDRGDEPPSPDFLYDPTTNIELGATYVDILMTRYLRRIEDYQNRLYSSISAYNTGAGNVMKSFGRGTTLSEGAKIINRMSSKDLFDHYRRNLPYEETRNYIRKVTEFRQYYTRYDQ